MSVWTLHTGKKMKPTPEFSPKNPVDGSRASVSTEIQAAAGDSAQAPGVAADDGAPPQRCPCCPCRAAEKVWLVAIRPSDSIALPRDRRSVVGVGSKGGLAGCAHELRRRHRRFGGRSWAARRAVFGWFPVAVLPTLGFPSRSKVRPATSTHVVQRERCCSRRIVGGRISCPSSSSRSSTSRRTSSFSCCISFHRSADPIRPSNR